MERVEQRRGTVREVTAEVEQQLYGWVQAQPDLTLAELQQKLAKAHHLQVSIGRLWQVLRQMGLRLKKVTLRQRTRHGSQSAAASSLPGDDPRDRAGAADLSR